MVKPLGRDLHEALWADGSLAAVSLPAKFRTTVWIKRGSSVLCCGLCVCLFVGEPGSFQERRVCPHLLLHHTLNDAAGHFVIVTPIDEGDRVRAEVAHVLQDRQIKHLVGASLWFVVFASWAWHGAHLYSQAISIYGK